MKTILITGASSGIGKATAMALLRLGHTVYVAARRVDAMRDLAELGAVPLAMDITQEADIERVAAMIEARHGAVDVLINNAGFGMYGSVEETTLADARYQFDVNLFGMARLTQRLLPAMRSRRAGTIINVSSMGGKMYTPLGAWYHATKHALEGWSDCLRLELQAFGIQVVIVEPGMIGTEFGDVMTAPMLKRSGSGPYAPLANTVAKAKVAMSPPEVIAKVMVKAVQSARPQTRYVAGSMAKPLLWARKWLSDRLYDRLIMSQVR